MRSFLTPLLAVTLCVVPMARGQSSFTVASTQTCNSLYAELDALLMVSGPYSIRLDSRQEGYLGIEASLAGLQEQGMPHVGVDFTPLPRAEVTGLQPATRSVRRTESAPQVGEGLASLGLGGLLLYAAFTSDDSDNATLGGLLGLLFVSGGITFLTNTRTVVDEVPDTDAIRANNAIRGRVTEENRRIDASNAERQQMKTELDRAIAANAEVAASRARLASELASYEAESRELHGARVEMLTVEGNRRCVDKVVATAVALRVRDLRGDLYIVMQPTNREGRLITDQVTLGSLQVTVMHAVIHEPLGELARLTSPVVVPLQSLERVPGLPRATGGYVALVTLDFVYDPVEMQRIVAEVDVQVVQDGRTFAASRTETVRVLD